MYGADSGSDDEGPRPGLLEQIPCILSENSKDLAESPEITTCTPGKTIAARLREYEDLGVIGSGNNGSVHRYRKINNGKLYAVKVMPVDREKKHFLIQNFHQVSTLPRDAPNLVRYYKIDFNEQDTICYLFMQYFDFKPLNPAARYPEEELRNIASQIFKGLKAMHANSFYHRDIKPDNILYDPKTGRVIIVDLGVGRRVRTDHTNTITGTPAYRAPEIGPAGYDSKVDIWAVGVTLYELVTGCKPFNNIRNRESNDVTQEIDMKKNECFNFDQPVWANYTPQLPELIKKLLKTEPADRYDCSQALTHPWFISSSLNSANTPCAENRKFISERLVQSQAKKSWLDLVGHNSINAQRKKEGSTKKNEIIVEGAIPFDSDVEEEIDDLEYFGFKDSTNIPWTESAKGVRERID